MAEESTSMLNLLAPLFKKVRLTNGNEVTVHKLRLAAQNLLLTELLKLDLRIPGDRLSLDDFQVAFGLDAGLERYDSFSANWNAMVVEFLLKQATLWPIALADVLRCRIEEAEQAAADDAMIVLLEAVRLYDIKQVRELGSAFFSETGALLDAIKRPKKDPPKASEVASPPGPIGASASSEPSPTPSPA